MISLYSRGSRRSRGPFKCTYDKCDLSFKTEEKRDRHKKSSKEHDFCATCNEDFDDWDGLARHRATETDIHQSACRVCGDEFGSVSGMKRHIAISHPIDQNIPCLGCAAVFNRASHLIAHLENNECKSISADQFVGHLQHKNIIRRLLRDPDQIKKINKNLQTQHAAIDDEEGGGVLLEPTLLDENKDDKLSDYASLDPQKSTAPVHPSVNNSRHWPALDSSGGPGKHPSIVTDDNTDTLSTHFDGISLNTSAIAGAVDWDERVEANVKGLVTRSAGSTISTSAMSVTSEDSATTQKPSAWGCTGTSTATSTILFPEAKATPVSPEWQEALVRRDRAYEREYGLNLFRARFWDPTSPGYNPKRFWDVTLEVYMCPFPHCEAALDTPFSLEIHIRNSHRMSEVRCPSCLRLFKTSAALVAHCETGLGRCQIARSSNFNQALDEFSGGFLSASYVLRPDHVPDFSNATDAEGEWQPQPVPVGYTQYESTKPPDWRDPQEELAG
ncbi:hypothetical protein K432DRAFT_417708 [Lepidopterella palustris CBS 459.81]|uniref:C2H2-type domain-containing protein n=1 Tax=Lepidopterella palustris CBS 459.81 TaxID=1314670 RepID=A0A8E2JDZ7_9PEZI|nr:hypothetical protein K432DRAFT_417708 [Lepidopterella palustris CBS 459.81]